VLSDMRPDINWSEDAETLIARATANADRLIRKLLIDSIALWAKSGFDRYDDREISFTVRLFACMKVIKAANRAEMVLIDPHYDGPLPSRDMQLGLADPAKTPRPDLNVKCGDALILIEAKKLKPTKYLTTQYVDEGMVRFIDGRYIPEGPSLAFMLSYIIKGVPTACYETVNNVIRAHAALRPDEVTKQREVVDLVTVFDSNHHFGEMLHYAVDVRGRKPSNTATSSSGQGASNDPAASPAPLQSSP